MIVGDSLTSDMQGGNNAGIICCWYNPNRKTVSTDVKIDYEIDRNADSDLQASGYKKNVAKFIINNVNFTVIAHKGKAFAKSLNYIEV